MDISDLPAWEDNTGEDDVDLLCQVTVPSYLKCPLSLDIMDDPVQALDGWVYERSCIERWFRLGRRTSPMTNLPLSSTQLTPVPILKRALDEFLLTQREDVRKALDHRSVRSIAASLERALQKQDRYTSSLEESFKSLSHSQVKAWRNLLLTAVSKGHDYVLRELGEAGVLAALQIISTDASLARLAVHSRREKVLEVLASLGAPLRECSMRDGTSLAHVAAANGDVKCLDVLSRYGVSLNATESIGGARPIHFAIVHGHPAAVLALLNYGVDVTVPTGLVGAVPLQFLKTSAEMVDALMRCGASVNDCGHYLNGNTPLHCAAARGDESYAETLLRRGAQSDAMNFFGETPADRAWNAGKSRIARRLDSCTGSQNDRVNWLVLGGGQTGGIVVRMGCALDTAPEQQRLAAGTLVRQVELHGQRLHFRKLVGTGPPSGWVSTSTNSSGALVFRTHMEDLEATVKHLCSRLLDFLAPECLPPKMTTVASARTGQIRRLASETAARLASHPSADFAEMMLMLMEIGHLITDFIGLEILPWEFNPIHNPLMGDQ